ncbi:site-specific DNA-methyltransferase [Parvibaculum sedimenti]|uniref:site-specific DNA-methyltransferase (adenine-specific) n=1 Tax=Parvibaculum sedimenti TaxID=2608632 RepID=A0A6N6VGJ6_9HYPH|nr:DNA methyltransferase [Parvibaculum sedimenti]KAB7739412.1 site-specific DNA-methyltransferase [Parvibaculum sedimenti]
MTNRLYYGDNLDILREHIRDESVDLVYLDPPFNSNASYNVLFKAPDGHDSHAQMEAFDDTWHWTDSAERAFDEVMRSGNSDAAEMLRAMRSFLKENDMMAYLTMMAVRLLELHRVLKQTGSLYLHCDPTASHYLKILLDAIFGPTNFGNEIVWKRQNAKGLAFTRFARNHDIILRYTKSDEWIWNGQYTEHDPEYLRQFYKYKDEDGRVYRLADLTNPNKNRPNLTYEFLGVTRVWRWTRERMQKAYEDGLVVQGKPGQVPVLKRYLDEQEGNPVDDVWLDVMPVQAQAQERLGYPTQKPLSLLERILNASSNEGDVVLDPFCGCGTTVHAAQKLNRQWIGIDVTHLAISLIQKRLRDAFGPISIDVHGVPKDLGGAQALAEQDKYQFQWWAVSLVDAVPFGGKKKGSDGGIDGYIYFKPDGKVTEKAVVSVKGGQNVGVTMVKDLIATVDREKAKMGVFITLAPPTGPMIKEAASAGRYHTEYGEYPKIQILTIEQLFEGRRPEMPWIDPTVFKKAKRETKDTQGKLL